MALASRAVLHHVNIHAYYPIYNTSYALRGKFGQKNQPDYVDYELSAVPSGEYFQIIRLFRTIFVLDSNYSEAELGMM